MERSTQTAQHKGSPQRHLQLLRFQIDIVTIPTHDGIKLIEAKQDARESRKGRSNLVVECKLN